MLACTDGCLPLERIPLLLIVIANTLTWFFIFSLIPPGLCLNHVMATNVVGAGKGGALITPSLLTRSFEDIKTATHLPSALTQA